MRRHRVHLCRIDQVYTLVQRVVDLCMAFGFGILLAKRHGTQTNDAHSDIRSTQSSILHRSRKYKQKFIAIN
jgi:hypothetical protein